QYNSASAGGRRWKRLQCVCVDLSRLWSSLDSPNLGRHNRQLMAWERLQPQKKSVPGISRSVQPGRSSRREAEARKKARRSTPRNVRHATEQRGTEDGLLS